MGNQKEITVQETAIREIIEGFKLHIGKIGIYDNETVKGALNEDIHQLQSLLA